MHYLKKMAPSSYNWVRLQDEETVELSYRGNSEIMAIKLKLAPFASGFLVFGMQTFNPLLHRQLVTAWFHY